MNKICNCVSCGTKLDKHSLVCVEIRVWHYDRNEKTLLTLCDSCVVTMFSMLKRG